MKQSAQPGNPVIRHKYTSDPAALVADGRVYLYTGHDEAPAGIYAYIMHEWLCFSSDDLVNWTEHEHVLHCGCFAWAKGDAWASQVVARNGKYYWYVTVAHASEYGHAIGVAVADRPEGPFRDARGSALISSATVPLAEDTDHMDPSVLTDHEGQTWIFWGRNRCRRARLSDNMIELTGPVEEVPLPQFSEGAWLHARNGWYYLLYGYGAPEKVGYAMSRDLSGPWDFKGILNEVPGNCETNRPCIIEYRGKWFFFYHNGALKGGGSHHRSVCIDALHYNADDTLKRIRMTSEGVAP